MPDYYIFGFGLLVTVLVGSGLATMIIANNRAIAKEERDAQVQAVARPVPAGERD